MLSETLKLLRTQMKLTQKELAASLGLDYKRYNHYETGRSEPDTETLVYMADFFNVSVDYLLGRSSQSAVSPGASDSLPEDEQALLSAYRRADDHTRRMVDLALEPYYASAPAVHTGPPAQPKRA